MSTLQLYDNLNKDVPKKDLTSDEKQKIVDIIPLLDQQATELIYAIVATHNVNDKKGIEYKKTVKANNLKGTSTITWNLKDLPIKLRHILYRFICMEEKLMDETKARELNQIKMKNEHVA